MEYGKIITLGRHRLMCGDATRREDVMQLVAGERVNLVLTDPPYGINVVDSGARMRRYKPIENDHSTELARLHYGIAQDITDKIILWGGQYFTDFLPVSYGWLQWDKKRGNKMSFGSGELAWSSFLRHNYVYTQYWNGGSYAGSRDINPSPHVHPTQKPVELHMKILDDFTTPGDIILDCFGGSGTTLIACEMTGRKCLMMEISPEYCDIIAQRFADLMPLLTHSKEDSQCPPQLD